jgi:histidyl-tRNA synthetase
MNIQAPRGTKDILPGESWKWQEIERAVAKIAGLYAYEEIRTPAFEHAKLFKRSIGEETDVVAKEMYLFSDKGGEEFALRPELTAPVVRAAIEHSLITGQAPCSRLYYNNSSAFRYEKPQLGRQRQFHQFGTELLGPAGAEADAETIAFAIAIFKELGMIGFEVRINSLASREARTIWKEKLVTYLREHINELSEESKKRTETNPMRVLDSKDRGDRTVVENAPILLEHLTEEDRAHFEQVQSLLKSSEIAYSIDPFLVRGLDYYSRTVFEVTSDALGAQDSLCGGGRYDYLVEQLDGPATPAVGFAAGVERVLIVLDKLRGEVGEPGRVDAYVIAPSPAGRAQAFQLAQRLRARGSRVSMDLQQRSFKAQMREANRLKASEVYILGDDELAAGEVTKKNMAEGSQERIALAAI